MSETTIPRALPADVDDAIRTYAAAVRQHFAVVEQLDKTLTCDAARAVMQDARAALDARLLALCEENESLRRELVEARELYEANHG